MTLADGPGAHERSFRNRSCRGIVGHRPFTPYPKIDRAADSLNAAVKNKTIEESAWYERAEDAAKSSISRCRKSTNFAFGPSTVLKCVCSRDPLPMITVPT